jgi:hypothetical protein
MEFLPLPGLSIRLFEAKQAFYEMRISRAYKTVDAQVTFTFFRFLCKNVAFVAFLVANLTGARYTETLFGT